MGYAGCLVSDNEIREGDESFGTQIYGDEFSRFGMCPIYKANEFMFSVTWGVNFITVNCAHRNSNLYNIARCPLIYIILVLIF